MSSGPRGVLKKIGRKVDIRLAALFTGIALALSLFLAGFTYFLLSSSLKRKDHEILRAKALELYVHYQSGGPVGLVTQVRSDVAAGEGETFFVQLRDSWDRPVFTHVPEVFREYDLERIKVLGVDRSGRFAMIRLANGRRRVLETVVLQLPDGNYLQLGMGIDERLGVLERFRGVALLVLIPLLGLSFFAGAVVASRALRPLRMLAERVRSVVETGNIRDRIPQQGRGTELDDLIVLFNGMLDRIEALVNAMRGALDSVAHELRTPLARLRVVAESALAGGGDTARLREALERGMEESEKILTMLTTFMDISEAETGILRLNRTGADLGALVADTVDLYRYVAEEKGITVESSVSGDLSALVDGARIRQAVANLIDNAVKYTPRGGWVRVTARRSGDEALLVVEDDGMGIGADEMPYIWDRLFRGEGAGSHPGIGLGLSLVKAVVEAHGGIVDAKSEPGRGSHFTVRIPLRSSDIKR